MGPLRSRDLPHRSSNRGVALLAQGRERGGHRRSRKRLRRPKRGNGRSVCRWIGRHCHNAGGDRRPWDNPYVSSTPSRRTVQLCSQSDCSQPAAYRTRSRDTWCDTHITAILRSGGLEPVEPSSSRTHGAWRGAWHAGARLTTDSSTPSRRTRSGKRPAGPVTGGSGRRIPADSWPRTRT